MIKIDERALTLDKYIRGAVNLFGAVTHRHILVIFNRYNKPRMYAGEYYLTVFELVKQSDKYSIYPDYVLKKDVHCEIMHNVLAGQQCKKYYIPTEEEINKYADENYYCETDYTEAFKNYLFKKFGFSIVKVEGLMSKLNNLIRAASPQQIIMDTIIESGVKIKNLDEVNELTMLITNLWNNTKMWVNSGYSPNETREIYLKEQQKEERRKKRAEAKNNQIIN